MVREELRRVRALLSSGGLSEETLPILAKTLEQLASRVEEDHRQIVNYLKLLEHNQRTMDLHLTGIENSALFRFLRWAGGPVVTTCSRVQAWLRRRGAHAESADLDRLAYQRWMAWESVRQRRDSWYRERAAGFEHKPEFSIILHVRNPRREGLTAAVESALGQLYGCRGLIVCMNGTLDEWARSYLLDLALRDHRVTVLPFDPRVSEPEALNAACSQAKSEYIAFLGENDSLSRLALYQVAETLQDGAADMVYTDEDCLDSRGGRTRPLFKPDWSPDLLLSSMYLGSLLVVSRAALERAGGFCRDFEGAHYYDAALRITDSPAAIKHVPAVVYHAHRNAVSAADSHARHLAGMRALEAAVKRRQLAAAVENGPANGQYHLRRRVQGTPLATIIICSRQPELLKRCLAAIEACTAYERRQIIVVHHVSAEAGDLAGLSAAGGFEYIRYDGPFHFSRMNNVAVESAKGEVLVFLNDDVEPLSRDWLTSLVAQAQRPEAGAVGAKLVYASGAIQHAGLAIGIRDGCGHPGRGLFGGSSHWPWLDLTRDVSAVTGACLAMRADLFRSLGGFDEDFPVNYNDADLCLRVRMAGLEVILEPGALLKHYECQSRVGRVVYGERADWYRRWANLLDDGDPFYNPNLTGLYEDVSLKLADE
jgi:GT2 family glycosyltransferase